MAIETKNCPKEIAHESKKYEKSKNITSLINETVIFNELLGKYDYFYTNILSNTKDINNFKIVNLNNNDFVLIDDVDDKRELKNKKNIMLEFDKYNEWDRIEEIFKLISNREDITYMTNGEIFNLF